MLLHGMMSLLDPGYPLKPKMDAGILGPKSLDILHGVASALESGVLLTHRFFHLLLGALF